MIRSVIPAAMKTKVHFAFLLSLFPLFTSLLYGQGQSLLTTGGGMALSNDRYLSYSIGEPLIQYVQINEHWLTEGYQQPEKIALMVSTDQHDTRREISVFPNPATTAITIAGNDLRGCTSITLHDLLGQPILTTKLAGKDSHTVTLDNLPPGLFIITVQCTETQYRTQSIIKL
jgi:hypothetical protein